MYDIRSGYLQDEAIHSSPYTRKDDEVRRCLSNRAWMSATSDVLSWFTVIPFFLLPC